MSRLDNTPKFTHNQALILLYKYAEENNLLNSIKGVDNFNEWLKNNLHKQLN